MHRNIAPVRILCSTGARVLLQKMIERGEHNSDYGVTLCQWLDGESSTLILRELSEPFGDYWHDLKFSNYVDELDSASLKSVVDKCR